MGSVPDRPNILVFLSDQHRHDWLGVGDTVPVRTPNIDRLAERGVRFTNTLCPSPLCAPSRACLASGRSYDRSPVRGNDDDYPPDETTYYELLRDRGGYHVAGCGKFDLRKASYSWGVDGTNGLEEWGFSDGIDNAGKWDAWDSGAEEPRDPYMAYLHRNGWAETHVNDFNERTGIDRFAATFPTPLPDEAYCDNWIACNGLALMEQFPADSPWHLVVNFAGPHEPMDVTERIHEWYRGDNPVEFPPPAANDDALDADMHTEIRRNYAAMIENIDRWVGEYLDRLEERNELEDTLIVFASDHGELLGDHGHWGKHSPYRPSVRVPLIVNGPGVTQSGPSDALVNLIDLSATFLEAAGVAQPDEADARSLLPVLCRETETHREYVCSGLGSWRLVFDGRYKLIENWDPTATDWTPEQQPAERDDKEEKESAANTGPVLFDLATDPNGTTNVAGDHPDVVADLAAKMPETER